MARKVISFILALLFVLGTATYISAAEASATVKCSFSQSDNKVTVNWGGNPVIGKVKILRDGVVYKDFSNIPENGSFDVIETEKGVHKYKAIAYNSDGNNITESDECSAVGMGEPKIRLEFVNGFNEKKVEGPYNDRIYTWVKIYNDGTMPLDVKKLKIRYFYTINGETSNGQKIEEASDQRLNPIYSFNDGQPRDETIPKSEVYTKFTKMAKPLAQADYFCQVYFSGTDLKIKSKYTFSMQPAFLKVLGDKEDNIRNYNFSDDYSYGESQNIAVYYNNELIWGNDPSVIIPAHVTAVFDVDRIKVNWDTCPGALAYIVYRSETGRDNDFTAIGTVAMPDESARQTYFDKNIQSSSTDKYNGKDYYYKVKAVYDEGIKSKYSEMVKVTADPFTSNEYWALSLKIVGKNASLPYFALGTYIPVEATLKFNQNVENPAIILRDDVCEVTGATHKLSANLVPKDSSSRYLSTVQPNVTVGSNTIRFSGSYSANTVISVQFVLKVSPSPESLSNGIKNYYSKKYELKFGLQCLQNGTVVEKNSDKALEVTILKPDKLR